MTLFCPNFFIPGAAKSGTTTLHELFNQHPEICMSSIKEPVYWNLHNYAQEDKINWYKKLFENPDAKVVGESTTSYMYYDSFIQNIKQHYNYEPKFIFILRNPIDRCYSHYWWMVGRGQEDRSFEDSIQHDCNRSFEEYGYVPNYYYHFSLYGKWLSRFYDNFERDRIKIITLEELTRNRETVINECFKFLGLTELNTIPDFKKNKTQKLRHPQLFHFVNKMASGKYGFTKFAKYFISRESIYGIKYKLKQMKFINSGKVLAYDKICDEHRVWLRSMYKEDVAMLKTISGRSYNEWTDFN